MADNKITNQIARTFEVEMPHARNMTEYLDKIIPMVRRWGEDLREGKFYEDKPWLEVSDSETFYDTVLHFFNAGGEYLRSVNGNVGGGSWRYMESANKLLLEYKGKTELYDLAFLNSKFFILKKHGVHEGNQKYFMMIYEPIGRRLEWRDALEELFNTYRSSNSLFLTLTVIILLAISIVVLLSLF